MTLDHCTEGWLIPDKIKQSGYDVILGPIQQIDKIELKIRQQKPLEFYRPGSMWPL